eukprot:jgi/Psemu1/315172/fgenesh1_kg.1920_\
MHRHSGLLRELWLGWVLCRVVLCCVVLCCYHDAPPPLEEDDDELSRRCAELGVGLLLRFGVEVDHEAPPPNPEEVPNGVFWIAPGRR